MDYLKGAAANLPRSIIVILICAVLGAFAAYGLVDLLVLPPVMRALLMALTAMILATGCFVLLIVIRRKLGRG